MQMDHSKAIKRIGILTSGGDAPGMNAAIRAIVIAAQHYQIATIGFCAGYNGLIDDVSIPLNVSRVSDIIHKGIKRPTGMDMQIAIIGISVFVEIRRFPRIYFSR